MPIKQTGLKAYSERLKGITSTKTRRNVSKAVYVGADSIRVEARRLIADGAIQGKGHIASAPGDPPNWDTGQLANDITTAQVGEFIADTTSSAPYAADLEYGTSKMAPRPSMQPAALNKRGEITRSIAQVYENAIKSGGG